MKLHPLLTACAALLALVPGPAAAQTTAVPGFISYQGRVVDAAGANVGTGTPVNRTVIFRIWDSASSTSTANLIYSESQTVTVSEGEFSVLVGQGVANPTQTFGYSESGKFLADLGTAFNGSARYLGVTVAAAATIALTDNEITPRQQIVSTAFAMRAKFAESIGSSSDLTLTPLSGTASNYGLGWYGTGRLFGTSVIDGPVLYGNAGGALGSNASGIYNTALRWDSSGRVGIGTTTPTVALDVTGAIKASGAITGGSFATSLGNVGIGTLTPTARLDIVDGTTAGTYGSVQISRPANGHTGSHLAFVRAGGQVMGMGYGQSSPTFGLGGAGPQNVFTPNILSIDANSNVGIGITTPTAKLDVNGNAYVRGQINVNGSIVMADQQSIWGTSIAGVPEAAFWPRSSDGTYLNYGTNGLFIRNNASTTTMFMGNTGNVGIGTSGSNFKLDVNGTVNVSGDIHTNNGAAILGKNSAGFYENCFYPRADNATVLQYGSNGFVIRNQSAVNAMTIGSNGQVKIGGGAPATGLLNVGAVASNVTWYASFGSTGQNLNDGLNVSQGVSITASSAILALTYLAESDRRIKTNLSPTDSVKDLKTLMGIEVTDYQLKDKAANSNAQHKKVIAQQVEEVYPQAVSRQKGVVPDIYQKASVKEGWVQLATDLKVGERVRLRLPSGDSVEDVLEVRSDSFRTSLKTPADELVVYGREVSDFRTVDYTAISMLNVSATQQLKHEKDAEMQALREENAALRRELAAKDESVEARLIALERRMTGEGEAKTVSLETAKVAE